MCKALTDMCACCGAMLMSATWEACCSALKSIFTQGWETTAEDGLEYARPEGGDSVFPQQTRLDRAGRTSQTDRHRLSRDLLQPGPREVVRNPAPSGRVNICVRREKKMKKTPRVNDRRGKQKRLQQEIKDLVNKTNWPDTEIRWLGNMVCAAETPLKNTQILRCESLASWIAAVTQTRMDFSRLFVRSWRRITSGPTLKPWRLLGTDPCLLRSSLKSRDTLKYRSWVSALCDFTLCLSSTLCQFFFVVHVNRVY